MSGPVRATLGRAARALARPEGERWDPALSFAPIERASFAEARAALGWLVRSRRDLAWLWERLDDPSRDVLAGVLAHRLAGSAVVAHGIGREEASELLRFAQTALCPQEVVVDGRTVNRYDLSALGLDLELITLPLYAVQTFLLEQYHHPGIAAAAVRPGDHVVDGGAFWGDTALWLAERAGPSGRVVAFEAGEEQLAVLRANVAGAGELGRRVAVRAQALWDRETELRFSSRGPASAISYAGERSVAAVALDALVAAGEVERVDFLKLDIEGAELAALRGAEATIRRFRPRMAIAVYHRWVDVIALPRFLAHVVPGYRFALAHRSVNRFETILFAWTEDEVASDPVLR